MTGTISKTPCPQCRTTGGLYLTSRIVAKPLGTFSLAGVQMKTTGRIKPVLKCSKCNLDIVGEYNGEHHAEFQPTSQEQ